MTTVYLIRHGEIRQTKPRCFLGQQDLPLTDQGRLQITRLAEYHYGRFTVLDRDGSCWRVGNINIQP